MTVAARLRVGIISGGDEIVSPDTDPGPGQIRDINSYTIAALVERKFGQGGPLNPVSRKMKPSQAAPGLPTPGQLMVPRRARTGWVSSS